MRQPMVARLPGQGGKFIRGQGQANGLVFQALRPSLHCIASHMPCCLCRCADGLWAGDAGHMHPPPSSLVGDIHPGSPGARGGRIPHQPRQGDELRGMPTRSGVLSSAQQCAACVALLVGRQAGFILHGCTARDHPAPPPPPTHTRPPSHLIKACHWAVLIARQVEAAQRVPAPPHRPQQQQGQTIRARRTQLCSWMALLWWAAQVVAGRPGQRAAAAPRSPPPALHPPERFHQLELGGDILARLQR